MDYSELVRAIREDDTRTIDIYLKALHQTLYSYLLVRLNTSKEDAEDSVQNTLIKIVQRVKNDKIQHPDALLSYAFTTARNDYFKKVEKKSEVLDEKIEYKALKQPDQLSVLINSEKKSLLMRCISELKEDHQKYIKYWFLNPSMDAEDVANHFKISVNNAWTKKHRIIKILNECYKSKLKM